MSTGHRSQRGRTRLADRIAIAVGAVLLGLSLGAPIVDGAPPTSSFYFESEPGDPTAQGRTGLTTSDESTFGAYNDGSTTTSVGVSGPLGWWLIYAFGPGGVELTPGTTYTNAAYLNEANPSQATLAPFWSGEGSCEFHTGSSGSFTVHDVAYANGLFTKLSMSFHLTCGSATGSLDGELRFVSSAPGYAAILQAPAGKSVGHFQDTAVGASSSTTTFTLTNAGGGSLALGGATKSGADPGDFQVVSDGCSGTTLTTGSACTFGVRMHPTATGDRSSTLAFSVGTASGHRRIALSGTGRVPTTTTLDAPSGLVFGTVTVTGHVNPAPAPANGFIPAISFLVDGNLSAAAPLDGAGDGSTDLSLSRGHHEIIASFAGWEELAASQSDPIELEMGVTTTVTLESSLNPALSTESITLTAQAAAGGVPLDGGTLDLVDETTAQSLGSMTISPDATILTVATTLPVGDHRLVASYSGHGSIGPSSARLSQSVTADVAVDASTIGLSWSKFYPVRDGYRDLLGVHGIRNEPISVEIAVFSTATGKLVRSTTIDSGTGYYVWTWNGRSASGVLQKAGRYRIVQTLTDGGSNQLVATSFATLSMKKLHWTTVSTTLRGASYALKLDTGNGYVSRTRSSYAGGVRIASGTAAAGVQYRFKVRSAVAYKTIAFKVLGRSPNGRHAAIAIWDPDLGSYLYAESFDAVKLVGPSYRWWSTSAPMTGRVKSGYARAVVVVAYGPGRATFDIATVRVTYRYGVLR